ncbi:MAG: ATP-binding protein [Proteobacteria bacterium]|nr:ATP-binding protein [Pseudomonadota bacterium]
MMKDNIRHFVISVIGQCLYRAYHHGWFRLDVADQEDRWPQGLQNLFQDWSTSLARKSETDYEDVLTKWQPMSFQSFWLKVLELACQEGDPVASRWCSLKERLDLKREEVTLLALLSAVEYDWHILRALRFAMSEQNPTLPRWGFLTRMLTGTDRETDACVSVLNPASSALFRESIILLDNAERAPLSSAFVRIYEPAAAFLNGIPVEKSAFESALPLPELDDYIACQVQAIQELEAPARVAVKGAIGSGRRHVCRVLTQALHCDGIWAFDLCQASSYDDALIKVRHVRAMAVLHNALIVVTAFPEAIERWDEALGIISERLHECCQPVAWMLSGDVPKWLKIRQDARITIPMPSRSEREVYWRDRCGAYLSDAWIQQLAGQFLMTRGQIAETVQAVSLGDIADEEARYMQLARAARGISKEGLGGLATPEPARVSFDQLIVSPECQTALEDLLMYARHRKELAKNWGFERSMPYGLGLSALFSGPPGTGKTYGAQVIASELRLELYRVDLSQLVSKYIGETEKHLSELFDAAEQGEVLLLFDEADSIFGKRTEVKSSVDRYANLEINYLLQRLERFTGVSILTSNFDTAIDEAFMRRIRFKVPFDMPESEARLTLWKKFLSPAIPRDDTVDLEFMAETFELSGGHIKEAVLRAASIAYGSEDQCVTQDLLIRSAQLEYKKLGKLAPMIRNNRYGEDSRWN